MVPRGKKHLDSPLPDGATFPRSDLYDDAAVREAVARLLAEDAIESDDDDVGRQERIAEVRRRINDGGYVSSEIIAEVVDKLLKKWRL